jgi:hypothetical protein
MNIEKYRNDGWGLSKKCLLNIENILNDFKTPNIVEFGSGISTSFLIDYLNENKKEGQVISFDNNLEYATKLKDPKLHLKIRNLVECDDKHFNEMFKIKKYLKHNMILKNEKSINTRQKNCFYEILDDDIPSSVDLLIVDGPHGNGRSISFLHLKEKLLIGSYVIIDDYNHYDFCDKFLSIFKADLIYECNTGKENQWELGGIYRIYKIK